MLIFFSTIKCEIPNWRLPTIFPLLLSQLKYFWNGAAETYLNQAFYCICKIYRNHIDEGATSQHSPCPLPLHRCGCSENEMLYVHTQSSLVSIIYVKLLYVKCQQAGSEAGSGHPTRKTPTAAPQITLVSQPHIQSATQYQLQAPSLSPCAVSVAFSVTDATQRRLKS